MPQWVNQTFHKVVDRAVELSIDGIIVMLWTAFAGLALAGLLYAKKVHPVILHGTVGALIGIGIVLVGTLCVHSARRYFDRRRAARSAGEAAKGFLDYKLQAEESLEQILPTLTSITNITENVGKSINVHAGRLRKAISLGTDKQMKATNNAASTLNRYSQELDSKCIKLERTGARIAEGLSGWLPWLHKQNNAEASAQVAAILRPLAARTDETIVRFNEYLAAVESNRGVSQALNAAVDAHIRSFSRVKVVTENIRKACLDNLEILEH